MAAKKKVNSRRPFSSGEGWVDGAWKGKKRGGDFVISVGGDDILLCKPALSVDAREAAQIVKRLADAAQLANGLSAEELEHMTTRRTILPHILGRLKQHLVKTAPRGEDPALLETWNVLTRGTPWEISIVHGHPVSDEEE